MSINSRYTAAEYAKRALDIAWDGNIPVNPEAIAKGLVIHKFDSNGQKVDIPIRVKPSNPFDSNGYSGQATLVSDPNGDYYLCEYNPLEVSYRTRFTIAHELGHVILAHVNEGNRMLRDNSTTNSYDPSEAAANAFAAELIMPEREVRKFFGVAKSLEDLADAFGVSTAAMNYRLKNLGLIG